MKKINTEIQNLLSLINPFNNVNLFQNTKYNKIEKKINNIIKILNDYLKEVHADTNSASEFDIKQLIRIFEWENKIESTTDIISSKAAAFIRKDGLLIDVGGNVGQFTNQILKRKKIRSIIFEPVPLYRDYCHLLFAGNENVAIEGVALSDSKDNVTLWMDHENMGWNTLISEKTTSKMHPINISTVKFDDYADECDLSMIDLIKIDVEGAEYKVLRGMRRTLNRIKRKPHIFMEIGWGKNHPAWKEETKEFEWLISHGYERFAYDIDKTTDVILRPKHDEIIFAENDWLPHITLGIPTRNRPGSVRRLLTSLLNQTYNNFSVLISEDGDSQKEIQQLSLDFKQLSITVIQGPGHSLPLNRQNIVDHCSTEIVMMCDDDHSLEPDCIELLVKTIMTDHSIGIVSAIWPDPNSLQCIDWENHKTEIEFRLDLKNINEFSDYWWKNGYKTFYYLHKNPKILNSEMSGGGCLIFRKSAILTAGSFPNCYSKVSFREDTDISHRIFLLNYQILIQPKAIAWHHTETKGGCRDVKDVNSMRQKDGEIFLKRLTSWRQKKEILVKRNLSTNPLRIAMLYDEKGWAWWLRTQNLIKYISKEITITSIQYQENFDHNQFDFIVAFEEYILSSLSKVPINKVIVGCSCPKYIDKAAKALEQGRAAAIVVNNYDTWRKIRHLNNAYCCQNGVDDEVFYPTTDRPEKLVACWIGHSKSIGNKGLAIIKAACRLANVQLIIHDKAENDKIYTQEWIRDNIYTKASIYICASMWEGTPNPALEAMMCGLPVISTRVGNMPEIIIDGYNGYLTERDPVAIAHKLDLIKNKDIHFLSKNAIMSVKNGWTWSQQAIKYEHMFKDLYTNNIINIRNIKNIENEEIRSILYVRIDSIGDTIIASKLTKSIREKFQNAKIHIVCQNFTAELYKYDPNIDEIISLDANKLNTDEEALFNFVTLLKDKNYDLAINSIWSRTALSDIITIYSGAKFTVAHEGDDCNISSDSKKILSDFYTMVIPSSNKYCAELIRHQDLAKALGLKTYRPRTTVHLSSREERFAESFFERTGFNPSNTVALFCGVQNSIRQYEHYGQALKYLCQERGLSVVALGSASDKALNDANLAQLTTPHYNLSGEASLLETAAVLKRCRIAVGAETGLAHMATALHKPTAVILGGGHYGRFMPFSPMHSIACLPLECYNCNWKCNYKNPFCINEIHPKTLETAIIISLDRPRLKPNIIVQPNLTLYSNEHKPKWSLHSIYLSKSQANFTILEPTFYQ